MSATRTPRKLRGPDRRRRYAAVVRRDGERCAWCGARHGLTLDHVVPLARGGSNRIENLQLLCHGCNQYKGDRWSGL